MTEKYKDFMERNSFNGKYDPKLGLEGLLTFLTPDPKVIVLNAMTDDTYFCQGQLYKEILRYLEKKELKDDIYPLTAPGTWGYFDVQRRGGESLIKFGAVRKIKANTPEGSKIGYCISDAGKDFGRLLAKGAIEFVYRARESNIPHQYDSMLKILGNIQSATNNRRQLAIYKIIKFLLNHSNYSCKEIIKAFKGEINEMVISNILNSLGETGIIDYKSPFRDINGRRNKGFIVYHLANKDLLKKDPKEIYYKIKEVKEYYRAKNYVLKTIKYIKKNPSKSYISNELSKKLKIPYSNLPVILSLLADFGYLKNEFTGGKTKSVVNANELTKRVYNLILHPAYILSTTLDANNNDLEELNGIHITPEKIKIFLKNYKEERTNIGRKGGEEIRKHILNLLNENKKMKKSRIVEKVNEKINRKLTRDGFKTQLMYLLKEGLLERKDRGYYRLRKENV